MDGDDFLKKRNCRVGSVRCPSLALYSFESSPLCSCFAMATGCMMSLQTRALRPMQFMFVVSEK